MGPPEAIFNPDCSGHLGKLGRRLKTWTRRFCVLKDACIYFFSSEEVSLVWVDNINHDDED